MNIPNKYKNGKIYKIVSPNTDMVYIGSTILTLELRLRKHRNNFSCWQRNGQHWVSSFNILQAGNDDIVLIEEYPCDDKYQLHARENYWMEQYKDVLVNKNKAATGMTKQEYKGYYYRANREQILTYMSAKKECTCGGKYAYRHRAQHLRTKKHQFYMTSQEVN